MVGEIMRYQVQWFPRGARTKYNIGKLYKAVLAQEGARNVEKIEATNRYNPWKPPEYPEAVQFTVTGGYPYELLENVNNHLMKSAKSAEPQGLSVRAISTIERKKSLIKPRQKRKKCGCK